MKKKKNWWYWAIEKEPMLKVSPSICIVFGKSSATPLFSASHQTFKEYHPVFFRFVECTWFEIYFMQQLSFCSALPGKGIYIVNICCKSLTGANVTDTPLHYNHSFKIVIPNFARNTRIKWVWQCSISYDRLNICLIRLFGKNLIWATLDFLSQWAKENRRSAGFEFKDLYFYIEYILFNIYYLW